MTVREALGHLGCILGVSSCDLLPSSQTVSHVLQSVDGSGAFFPVLPNVVNENCFPLEYRWHKNQPPVRSGDFKEFKECMDKYEIEIHFVDFLDNTLDKQLKSWVKQLNRWSLNRWSLLPIKYTSQVCVSAFIESTAKSGSSAEAHVRWGSSVRQNNLECGPIAAGVTYTGYRQWQPR